MGHTFNCSSGNVWSPKVTCRVLERFEQETGIGLLEEVFTVLKQFNAEDKIQLNIPQVIEALSNILKGKFSNVLLLAYLSVEKQAKERDVDRETFSESFEGNNVAEVFKAIGGAYSDFFQSLLTALGKSEGNLKKG